jgi:hypothetical protein
MCDIALEPFHSTNRIKLSVEIAHDLARDLERYKMFYKQAYSADVSEADLLREMARRFMEGDREFQAAKQRLKARPRPKKPAAATNAQEPEKQEKQA